MSQDPLLSSPAPEPLQPQAVTHASTPINCDGYQSIAGTRRRSMDDDESRPLLASVAGGRSGGFTSAPAAVFLTVNACLGAGLLNMPFAFQASGGLLIGSLVQLIMLLIIMSGMVMLTYCAHQARGHDADAGSRRRTSSYGCISRGVDDGDASDGGISGHGGCKSFQDVVRCFAGETAARITNVCIILYSYAACLTFIVIIGDQMDRMLASLVGPDFCHSWFMARTFTMPALSVLLILPLCFSKSIDFLKYSR